MPETIVFYISGHGFGHASRTIEVINALLKRRAGVRVHVRTKVARWLFDLTVAGSFDYADVECDTGVVQIDALTPDIEATMARAAAFHAQSDAWIGREAQALSDCEATVVVADVPPMAFAAASRAAVPAIALTNFTWDWIYEDYAEALEIAPQLAREMRDWQRSALEAWKLPMSGGFEGFSCVRELPLIARRSRRERTETRDAMGWDERRPVLLVSFGGIGMRDLPLEAVSRSGEVTLVTAAMPGDSRPWSSSMTRTTDDGLMVIDERRLYENGWRYEDLVAAADVVVTKPGYGIIAECIAGETALLYTSRGRFAEYAVLVETMPRWLRCRFIDCEDFARGAWAGHADAVLRQPPPPERPALDGADVAAQWLCEYLDGKN